MPLFFKKKNYEKPVIGLLGGSFNPAHEGHISISEQAVPLLGLDKVWWLVTPQNPLKPSSGLLPYEERLAYARTISAAHPMIEVSDFGAPLKTRFQENNNGAGPDPKTAAYLNVREDLRNGKPRQDSLKVGFSEVPFENHLPSHYTYDLLQALFTAYPHRTFIWLMGTDNLLQFPKWYRWEDILHLLPIAILDRAPYTKEALEGTVAQQYASSRIMDGKKLATSPLPAWCLVEIKKHPASSTEIRKNYTKPS